MQEAEEEEEEPRFGGRSTELLGHFAASEISSCALKMAAGVFLPPQFQLLTLQPAGGGVSAALQACVSGYDTNQSAHNAPDRASMGSSALHEALDRKTTREVECEGLNRAGVDPVCPGLALARSSLLLTEAENRSGASGPLPLHGSLLKRSTGALWIHSIAAHSLLDEPIDMRSDGRAHDE
ncbi:unnamed protein product [Pleuronectes platessa]|uniref:Uncharacterized protein n=1 Tax=Pleuronectes platessa TaxID=8262 RepID=A0A9N7TXK5_PLEPL|nr:unnamed protein product [Pleuronectes platessa]